MPRRPPAGASLRPSGPATTTPAGTRPPPPAGSVGTRRATSTPAAARYPYRSPYARTQDRPSGQPRPQRTLATRRRTHQLHLPRRPHHRVESVRRPAELRVPSGELVLQLLKHPSHVPAALSSERSDRLSPNHLSPGCRDRSDRDVHAKRLGRRTQRRHTHGTPVVRL